MQPSRHARANMGGVAALALLLAACSASPERQKAEVIAGYERESGHKAVTTPSGLVFIPLIEGSGDSPRIQDNVTVHYMGKLLDGRKFDSSYDRKEPLKHRLKFLIKGWQEALPMMKKGGKAVLIAPPDLAYGKESKPGIPGGSTLVFEIELLDIERGAQPAKTS